ncbi:hypothetical protein ABIA10_006895 [Rhizobium leguminosarum]
MDTPAIIVDYAQVIQTSLAPVFLLAGTGGFVGIYVTRLGRVSDRLNEVTDTPLPRQNRQRQLMYLRRRTLILEVAVIFGAVAGICTCCAILNLLSGRPGDTFATRKPRLVLRRRDRIIDVVAGFVPA